MTDTQNAGRRGGRAARQALRAAPLATDIRPVNPGMESGRYQPLTNAEVLRVHEAALNVLENIGLADAIPSCLELLLPKGCRLTDTGRLLFPRSLVEDTLAVAGRHFVLHGQDPKYDMEPWGKKVYFGTAGAAVNIVDPVTGNYRESVAQDCYDIARLVDTLEHIHFYQRTVVPRDLPDPAEMDINTCYLSVAGTTKHVGTSWVHPDHLEASLKMLHHIAGGEDKWRERPFVSQSNCFVVPPLKFAADACKCLEVAVRGGMPVLLLSAGQAGATAPAALAGALVQEVAEAVTVDRHVGRQGGVPGHAASSSWIVRSREPHRHGFVLVTPRTPVSTPWRGVISGIREEIESVSPPSSDQSRDGKCSPPLAHSNAIVGPRTISLRRSTPSIFDSSSMASGRAHTVRPPSTRAGSWPNILNPSSVGRSTPKIPVGANCRQMASTRPASNMLASAFVP